jgi:hypothetical protein
VECEKFFYTDEDIVIVKGGVVGEVKCIILGFSNEKSASGEWGYGSVGRWLFRDREPEGVPREGRRGVG